MMIRAFLLLCLVLGSGDALSAQVLRGFEPKGRKDLFPSMIISTYRAMAEQGRSDNPRKIGSMGAAYWADVVVAQPTSVVLELTCAKFMQRSSIRANLQGTGKYTLMPIINWNFDALYTVSEPEPAVVTFRVLSGEGRELAREEWPITVHSMNECATSYVDEDTGKWQNSALLVAAYVNENHPLIEQILKKALDRNLVPEFLGPQAKTKAAAINEMDAVWTVLKSMGLRYSSIAKVGTATPNMRTQNIRFLDEAVKSTQANCVDGSVLIASIFMRIGLDTQLVFYPNHCQVTIHYPVMGGPVPIETTMLGNKGGDIGDAVQEAGKRMEKVVGRFGKSDGYFMVDIREARKVGIQPLRSRRAAAAR
jgi:hypothetical protein